MALQKKVKKQRNPQNWDDTVDKEEPTEADLEKDLEAFDRDYENMDYLEDEE